ncbi:MAG: 2-(1,2-epoxy-1,2-dihydrophenyl)acetyl-CoA isomerase [Gammaproteobacteria bacterium]|nr:2-(1,2-epoxy-1,2-dihydrophenyl)acetyl-CoA isomerase [Gammaproteobacteria bacterium]
MAYQTIQFSESGGVAELVLNRPDSLNSFNAAMHAEVRESLESVRKNASIRALLLTGAGRGFCAGQDLGDRAVRGDSAPVDLARTLDTQYNPMIRAIRALPIPVVCAVNGVAAGAGANLALACDLVIAARSAKFIQAFCKVGLLPDSGGTWFLPRLVGEARAKALAMLGTPVSAEEAQAMGMIYRVVDDSELAGEARKLCVDLATQPTRGLAATKAAIELAWDNSLDTQLDLERDRQGKLGLSADYREGVAAFFEKRPPKFTGK